jgi:ketosteroid isomerase-like protein
MREVVERYFEIMNRLEIDALGDLFADDVVFRLPFAPEPIPQETVGKAAVLEVYSGFPSLVSPLGFHDIEIKPLAADGGYVATYQSDCTMLPTGAPYRNRYIALFEVRDGKLAAFAEYFDPVVFLEALGTKIERSPA